MARMARPRARYYRRAEAGLLVQLQTFPDPKLEAGSRERVDQEREREGKATLVREGISINSGLLSHGFRKVFMYRGCFTNGYPGQC